MVYNGYLFDQPFTNRVYSHACQSKEECKDQESIQSNTIPDFGRHKAK